MTPKLLAVMGILFVAIFLADMRGLLRGAVARVGLVTEVSGTVRRMAAQQLTWDLAPTGSVLGRLDAVATDTDGSTRILLDSGSDILLGPNSMIVIEDTAERVVLHLLKGAPRLRVLKESIKKFEIRSVLPKPVVSIVETLSEPDIAPALPAPTLPSSKPDDSLRTRVHPVKVK